VRYRRKGLFFTCFALHDLELWSPADPAVDRFTSMPICDNSHHNWLNRFHKFDNGRMDR